MAQQKIKQSDKCCELKLSKWTVILKSINLNKLTMILCSLLWKSKFGTIDLNELSISECLAMSVASMHLKMKTN